MTDELEPTIQLQNGAFIRTKHHVVEPMTAEDAAAQIELLGHSFFVFANSSSGAFNVVYRRHDGEYGLIVPESAPPPA